MLLSVPAQVRVYLSCEPTDMRKQVDGLCAIVQHGFHRDPFNGDVFAFFNKRRTHARLLVWDGNGFWMASKRLEGGRFDNWRPATDGSKHATIDRSQLMMLLEGIELRKAKVRRHFARSVRIGKRGG